MNTQASTEEAKTLYHKQGKQTEDAVYFWFVRKITKIGEGEDTNTLSYQRVLLTVNTPR